MGGAAATTSSNSTASKRQHFHPLPTSPPATSHRNLLARIRIKGRGRRHCHLADETATTQNKTTRRLRMNGGGADKWCGCTRHSAGAEADGVGWSRMEADGGGWKRLEAAGNGF